MEAIDLVAKIFGINAAQRDDLQNVLKNTAPEHLELALMNLGQHPDDEDFDQTVDAWMEAYLPEVKVG